MSAAEKKSPHPLKVASLARQLLLLAVAMNLLALLTAFDPSFGLIPSALFAIAVLSGVGGIAYVRPLMRFSGFVMGVCCLIACVPAANLLLLVPLYRRAETLLALVRSEVDKAEALARVRERSPTPPPATVAPAVMAAAPAQGDYNKSDTIEFKAVSLAELKGDAS